MTQIGYNPEANDKTYAARILRAFASNGQRVHVEKVDEIMQKQWLGITDPTNIISLKFFGNYVAALQAKRDLGAQGISSEVSAKHRDYLNIDTKQHEFDANVEELKKIVERREAIQSEPQGGIDTKKYQTFQNRRRE